MYLLPERGLQFANTRPSSDALGSLMFNHTWIVIYYFASAET